MEYLAKDTLNSGVGDSLNRKLRAPNEPHNLFYPTSFVQIVQHTRELEFKPSKLSVGINRCSNIARKENINGCVLVNLYEQAKSIHGVDTFND